MEPNEDQHEEVIKVPEENPESWRPGLAELARFAEDIVSDKAREEKATNTTEL